MPRGHRLPRGGCSGKFHLGVCPETGRGPARLLPALRLRAGLQSGWPPGAPVLWRAWVKVVPAARDARHYPCIRTLPLHPGPRLCSVTSRFPHHQLKGRWPGLGQPRPGRQPRAVLSPPPEEPGGPPAQLSPQAGVWFSEQGRQETLAA